MTPRFTISLWFDDQAEEAAHFYCSIFKDSRILSTANYPEGAPGPVGTPMVVEWEIEGQRFNGINGGPMFTFSEAVSVQVNCKDQDEVDYYWERLTADGGQEAPCGWCKDKYGLSWQVVPEGMDAVFADPDPTKAQRAFAAMSQMTKIDVAALRAAAAG